MNEELKNRLESRIKISKNGCWNYTRYKSVKGYGKLSAWGKMHLAHRVSYIVFRGEIPKGLFLDHLCRNPSCINPNHLEIVTNQENLLRGMGIAAINSRKTHCINGHKLSGKNLRMKKGRLGRICKKCNLIHWKKWYKKNKPRRKFRAEIIRDR